MAMAHIPYGAYWSTPFVRWQGAFGGLHALRFAASTTVSTLNQRQIAPAQFDFGVLGSTVPQQSCFYGLPWVAGLIGAAQIGGPTINQACATGARIVQTAAQEVAGGASNCALVVAADRVSNGPLLAYPGPDGDQDSAVRENWVMDNFAGDPYAGLSMVETAENVASKYGISRDEQHDVVEMRHAQYQQARARNFHARFMDLPFAVPGDDFAEPVGQLDGDDGVYPSSREKMDRLQPVVDGGTVTYAGQTYPADGNAAMVVTSAATAEALSRRPEIEISIESFGLARTERGFMPQAPVPAAQRALDAGALTMDQIDVVKTHNPFAVNDIVFARETGYSLERMNNNGCSLIFGHPQGPTGLRLIIELIEELVERGGGTGLFTGCAAGDTGMAAVLRVA